MKAAHSARYTDLPWTSEVRPARRADLYRDAARRMRRGKVLVTSGFVVAVVGMVGYTLACLAAGVNADLGATFLQNPGVLVAPTIGVIGLGTLLWLVGSFVYLTGAIDSDPESGDISF